MKKHSFKLYLSLWAIQFAIVNLVIFLIPEFVEGSKFKGSFWIGYALIIIAFLSEICCAAYAFKASNLQKMFYRLPLIYISYGSTVSMTVLGSLFMTINFIPQWIAGLICIIIFSINLIIVFKAGTAAKIVDDLDGKVKTQTFFIKSLSIEAEQLMELSSKPETKNLCKRVYEAIQYSDPISNPELSVLENKISAKFDELSLAVRNGSHDITEIAEEITNLISERNKKCKFLK